MKKTILSFMLIMCVAIANAFSVKYSNKDSKSHKMEVKVNGTSRYIEFKSGTSSTASVSMSASEVEIKTDCGWVKVKDGAKIIIKDGCIEID